MQLEIGTLVQYTILGSINRNSSWISDFENSGSTSEATDQFSGTLVLFFLKILTLLLSFDHPNS